MRDHVEGFIASGGNVCFFNGNTCWWQVRFERRDSSGGLISSNDPRSMVCYKMELPPFDPQTRIGADPMFSQDQSRLTTHWHLPTPPRPENKLTGVSYRNGAFNAGLTSGQRGSCNYESEFPKHWVFQNVNGTQFANSIFTLDGIETDAALFSRTNGVPGATGQDGSPLNTIVLATCDLTRSRFPTIAQGGMATMCLYRNVGVVFSAGLMGWHYGLYGPTEPAMQNITRNLLLRLRQRGPWKMDRALTLPSGQVVYPYYFESWSNGSQPDGWIVTGAATISKGGLAPPTGNHSLDVDATMGQTWFTENY